jgi:ATP-dependent RNA helicase RhlE
MLHDCPQSGLSFLKNETENCTTFERNQLTNFENMDLFSPLKKALADQKYIVPTPIQHKTIPDAVEGKDILGCAQTGTGKTAAFALPILDYIGHERPERIRRGATSLVLAPTRELAIQIAESFQVYGKHMKFRLATVYGGVNQSRQVNAMKEGVDVLIATPGRLLDLVNQNHIRLGDIQILVLDEADRMLDMGFLPDLRRIISKIPENRQSMFFSATLPDKTIELANRMLFNPVHVTVATKPADASRISQSVRLVPRNRKMEILRDILSCDTVERAIVFTRTKRNANRVARQLESAGFGSAAIHGNKSQSARQKALENFRQKRVSVLVATDVASRGIDIDEVSHVINYDMPVEPECYMHRIGRTGRAGLTGVAISLCTGDERKELRAIERLTGKRIPVEGPDESRTDETRRSNSGGSGKPRRSSGRSRKSSRNGASQSAKPGRNRRSSNGNRKKKTGDNRGNSSSRTSANSR